MQDKDKTISEIARKHFHIKTLERRGLDRLDFHEVSVSSVKSALEEAFETGLNAQLASAVNKQLYTDRQIIDTVKDLAGKNRASVSGNPDYEWTSMSDIRRALPGIKKEDVEKLVQNGMIIAIPGDGIITWCTKYSA